MSVLENFKNIPRSPYGGATGLKCNFFSSNLQRSPWRKKKHHYSEFSKKEKNGSNCSNLHWGPCRPPNGRQGPVAPGVGDRGLSPVGGATGPPLFFSPGTSLQI